MKKFSDDSKRKLGNTILYLSQNVEDLSKSKMIKLLYLMEEEMVRSHIAPFLALQYEVWQYGPVAKEIYAGFSNSPTILKEYVYTSLTEDGTYIMPNKEFTPSDFNSAELEMMDVVVREYGKLKARELKDFTHRPESLWYKKAKANGLIEAFERQECTSSDVEIDFSELLSEEQKPVYLKRLSEVEAVNELKITFQDYQRYQKGWDGEDALPLTSKVVENFRKVLRAGDNEILSSINIFPDDNGTLEIQSKIGMAGLSIGNDGFSKYVVDNGHVIGENHIPFSPENVLDAIRSFTKVD